MLDPISNNFNFMSFAVLSCLSGLALWICWADWKTTRVRLLDLIALLAGAILFVALLPFHETHLHEHLLGGPVGGGVAYLIRQMGARRGRETFGEADVWVAGIGGLMLGLEWVGIWFGIAAFTGLAVYPFIKREDTEEEGMIIPFLPVFLVTLLILTWGRWLDILPGQAF